MNVHFHHAIKEKHLMCEPQAKRMKIVDQDDAINEELLKYQLDAKSKKKVVMRTPTEEKEVIDKFRNKWNDSDLSRNLFPEMYSGKLFKDFYRLAFRELVIEGKNQIPTDSAISAWKLLFERMEFPHLNLFYSFLEKEQSSYSVISRVFSFLIDLTQKDTWEMTLDFFVNMDKKFESFRDDSPYPCLFDDYVGYARKELNLPIPQSSSSFDPIETWTSPVTSNTISSTPRSSYSLYSSFGSSGAGSFLSKGEFVGLQNQGATCYLNSLLQTLFMTPEFREAVYAFQGFEQDPLSIPSQLQKLFAKLQTSSKRSVGTKALTKSFGWTSVDSFTQHDVQELCRILFDALEDGFKGSRLETLVNDLYQGSMIDYVQCTECNYRSTRSDTFLDISLGLHSVSELEEAFSNYTKPELLSGDSQWKCSKCNKKVDALKGLSFTSFPYIMMVHLKRFDYDYNLDRRVKLSHRVSFPLKLNMQQFVCKREESPSNDTSQPHTPNKDTQENGTTSPLKESSTVPSTSSTIPSTSSADNLRKIAVLQKAIDAFTEQIEKSDDLVSPLVDAWRMERKNKRKELEQLLELESGVSSGPVKLSTSSTSSLPSFPSEEEADYELFSVLVHSGSATGGHYYAYIRSFEKDKWFNFNDSSVTPIPESEIAKTFGETLTSNFSFSSTAYMLIYRKIDPQRNVNKVDADKVPDIPLSQKSDEKVEKEKEEAGSYLPSNSSPLRGDGLSDYEDISLGDDAVEDDGEDVVQMEEEGILYMSVFYKDERMNLTTSVFDTIDTYTKKICKAFKVDLPAECTRLRRYDLLNRIAKKPFDDKEKTWGEEGYEEEGGDTLLLETKGLDEEWKAYTPGMMAMKVIKFDSAKKDFEEPIDLEIRNTSTLGDLKLELEKKLEIPLSAQRVFLERQMISNTLEELKGDSLQLDSMDLRVTGGKTVYVGEEPKDGTSFELLSEWRNKQKTFVSYKPKEKVLTIQKRSVK